MLLKKSLKYLISCFLCVSCAALTFAQNPNIVGEYDFIVVGGGTAGCTVAGLLSQCGNYTVLLIEAGDVPHPDLAVPALLHRYFENGGAFKVYPSLPQQTAGLNNGGVVNYIVGSGLGGSSSINGMMFNRGSPHGYNSWAHITNDSSWTYENLMRYFKKIENYQGKYPSKSQHGKGGPITVTQPNYVPGLNEWLRGGQLLGYPTADPNGPQIPSFTPSEFSKKFGRRVSSYTAYIEPYLDSRPNLKVLTNSTVKLIRFDGNRAVGVVYQTALQGKSVLNFVLARREIIISAGVVGSPALLMKSGIGPADVLSAAGISAVKHLPGVGYGFQDHTTVPINLLLNSRSQIFVPERDLNQASWLYYNKFGDGPYSAYMNQLQAFLVSSVATRPPSSNFTIRRKTNYLSQNLLWPDTHLLFCQNTLSALGVKPEDVGALPGEHVVSSWVLLARPKSVGRVTLNMTDPLNSDPLLDFNFYSHPDDLTAIMEGMRTTLKLFEKTLPYQIAGVRYPSVPIPQCKSLKFRSYDYWRCYIRHRTRSGFHGAGTCRMGRGHKDPNAVVDSKLKVIGIENLRVVDASVMPTVTNANTMVGTYVIAEKAADMIMTDNFKNKYS